MQTAKYQSWNNDLQETIESGFLQKKEIEKESSK